MPSPDEWRSRLATLRAAIETDLAAGAEASKPVELDQARVGRISRMDAMRAQAMSIAAKQRREVQIVRIDAALRRLDEGEFGYCMECGNEIRGRD